jgi:uncharacterized protein
MLFVLICDDRPGALDLRMANRGTHLEYIEMTGSVVQAGPLLDEAGEMCGSLLILDVPDRAAAEAWAAGDPYAMAGLFERVEIRAWNRVVG